MCIPPPSPSREGGFLPLRQCPMRRREAERSEALSALAPPCDCPLRHPAEKRPAPLASSRTNVRDLLVFCHFPGDSSLRFGMTEERGRAPRYFAPMGLVRRFVGMLLQAGIPPRVGRNDMKKELTAPLGGKKVRLQMQPHLFASPSLQVIRRGRCRTPCPSPRSRGGRVRRQAPRRPFRRTGGAASSRARRTRTSFRAKGTCAPR